MHVVHSWAIFALPLHITLLLLSVQLRLSTTLITHNCFESEVFKLVIALNWRPSHVCVKQLLKMSWLSVLTLNKSSQTSRLHHYRSYSRLHCYFTSLFTAGAFLQYFLTAWDTPYPSTHSPALVPRPRVRSSQGSKERLMLRMGIWTKPLPFPKK